MSSHARSEVKNLAFISDDVVWLSWKLSAEEYVPNITRTSEVIFAYVTASPRIHLYSFPERMQENAIYCDTKSVMFIHPSA